MCAKYSHGNFIALGTLNYLCIFQAEFAITRVTQMLISIYKSLFQGHILEKM